MSKEKNVTVTLTSEITNIPAPPTFKVVGFEISDHMPVAVDGRQIDLANVTPEQIAWLFERKEKLSGLSWI